MAYRVIHLIDPEAGHYQWPFKLGEWVWSKTHRIAATVVGGWFELRSFGRRQGPVPESDGVQVFYRVETPDGREFTEPAQDLEPRSSTTL
jgi:hypothetical protein